MVDPLGKTPAIAQGGDRIAPVTRIAPAASAVPPRSETVVQSSLAGSVREASARPPVDLERVARIRKAVADGNFPIYPATIADRLIALKMQWTPHDEQ